jgi:molybdate transport system regulatory protein
MKYGARNQWVGRVVEIKKGAVMSQVTLELAPGLRATSVLTLDSLRELGLKKNSRARVLVKAVNVLLTTED